jgi:hypothetical protein
LSCACFLISNCFCVGGGGGGPAGPRPTPWIRAPAPYDRHVRRAHAPPVLDRDGPFEFIRFPDSFLQIILRFSTCDKFLAVGEIQSWQLGTLRILLQHGSTLSKEDQQHILRISNNDQELLDELMAIQDL